MRANAVIFAIVAFFAFVSDVVYWFMSHDPTGTTALAFFFGLAYLIAYYLFFNARRLPPQPEDQTDADISDGAGEMGFFSPHSYWPFYMGIGAFVFALGIVFGWWLAILGALILIPASVGLLFEYYIHDLRSQVGSAPIGEHEPHH